MPMDRKSEAYRAWRRQWQRARAKRLRDAWIAEHGPCQACGATTSLEIDHVDRSSKERKIEWSRAKTVLEKELLKCQVLCKRCHLEKTVTEVPSRLVHGSSNMYRNGPCRCDLCRAAHVAACGLSRARRKERTGRDR